MSWKHYATRACHAAELALQRFFATTRKLWGGGEGFLGKMLLAIVTTLLLGGLLENYKNRASLTMTILESYRAVARQGMECLHTHNDFVLAYYPYAGNFLIQAQELDRVIESQEKGLPEEYGAWLTALLQSAQKENEEIAALKQKTDDCYRGLYPAYEELAILLDLTPNYQTILEERAKILNQTYAEQKVKASDFVGDIDVNSILKPFRFGIEQSLIQDKSKWIGYIRRAADIQRSDAAYEQRRFEAEQKAYEQFRSLYMAAIRKRLGSPFMNYLIGT